MTPQPSQPDRRGRDRRNRTLPEDVTVCDVDRSDMLEDICAQIRDCGIFAFDTEFVMEDRYRPQICLVQLATDSMVALVDPFAVKDLSPVWSMISDPALETVVHAGAEDFALCHSLGGRPPANIFDCQVACGLVSSDYPLSLSRMVKSLFRVRLHKSQTLTEWGRRPLTPEQKQYAASDVVHLPAAYRKISRRLEHMGRMHWLREEMARFTNPDFYRRDSDAGALKLKGAGGLDGRGLAIARELVKTREQVASRLNRPVRGVVRDHLIIEIARHRWTDVQQIKKLRGLNLRNEAVRMLADAVARACALPIEKCPEVAPPRDESDQEAAMSMLITAVIRARCAEQNIAHQLVASRQTIRNFVRDVVRGEEHKGTTPLSSGWRAEAVGTLVRDVLAGRLGVSIRETPAGRTVVMSPDGNVATGN